MAETVAEPIEAPAAERGVVETLGTVFSLDVRGGEPGAVRAAVVEAM